MEPIDLLKEYLQRGDVEGLVALLEQGNTRRNFRTLGQAVLWEGNLKNFERLLEVGLFLKDCEVLLLDLGLQLIPPGLPDNAWATPPISGLLEAGYRLVEAALADYPEPLGIFHKVVLMQQDEVRRQSDFGPHPRHGWG